MIRLAIVVIVAAVAGAPALAADSSVSPARKAAAMAMLEACKQREQVEAYFDKLAESQASKARASLQELSEEQWQRFTVAFRENLHGYIDRYIDMTATIDATHFSEEDMGVLADFCRSPIGQRVSALRAQMERETFELRGAWLQGAVSAAGTDALKTVMPDAPGGGL